MEQAPADKKPLYFNILASVGDKKSLAAISSVYARGDDATKQAAVTALSQWADVSAAPELYLISKETTNADLKNQALRGYVAAISKSNYPADEKIIYLRDAMDIAQLFHRKN